MSLDHPDSQSRWTVDHIETEPMTAEQHAAAVAAFANLISRWQTGHPAESAPGQPAGPAAKPPINPR